MKKNVFLAAGVIIVVAAIVVFMLSRDSKPSVIEVKSGELNIGGSFGTTVAVGDISGLQLTETMPKITRKTNGSGVGSVSKGEFLLESDKKARLYVDTSKPPFIMFYASDTVYYLNLDTPEQTKNLYQQLTEAMK